MDLAHTREIFTFASNNKEIRAKRNFNIVFNNTNKVREYES